MSTTLDAIQPKKHTFGPIDPMKESTQLDQMEKEHEILLKHFETMANEMQAPPADSSLKMVDPKLAQEALDIVNRIRVKTGETPITNQNVIRRLHTLLSRIAQVVDSHIFLNKDKNFSKEQDIKKNKVPEVSSWTKWQGVVSSAGGIVSPIILFFGSFLSPDIAAALSQGVQSLAHGGNSLIEQKKMSPSYEKDLHLQTSSSEKQVLESIKRLPEQIQNDVKELARVELEMIRKMYQQ